MKRMNKTLALAAALTMVLGAGTPSLAATRMVKPLQTHESAKTTAHKNSKSKKSAAQLVTIAQGIYPLFTLDHTIPMYKYLTEDPFRDVRKQPTVVWDTLDAMQLYNDEQIPARWDGTEPLSKTVYGIDRPLTKAYAATLFCYEFQPAPWMTLRADGHNVSPYAWEKSTGLLDGTVTPTTEEYNSTSNAWSVLSVYLTTDHVVSYAGVQTATCTGQPTNGGLNVCQEMAPGTFTELPPITPPPGTGTTTTSGTTATATNLHLVVYNNNLYAATDVGVWEYTP